MREVRCPHCTHSQLFLSNDQKCSCCAKGLFDSTIRVPTSSIPADPASSMGNDSTARWEDARRTKRLEENTTFQVTCQETETPDFVDFLNDAPRSMENLRLEVLVDLPIERASSDEMSIPVIIKTDLKGVQVAVWLRRDNLQGGGVEDYRHTTNTSCNVALKLDADHRQFELCIQPKNARNWLWTVTVPVLRKADVDQIPRTYNFDQSRHVHGDGPYLEGYTNNQITIVDQASPQATSRQFALILCPTPRKKRTRRVQPTICARRKRAVSEFTLEIQSERWHIHGGSSLTFGRDKPLPGRDNTNDIVFRPHHDDEIIKQVSQSHGVFELHSHSIRYRHSEVGRNQQKRTLVLLSNASQHTVRQPEEFVVPDPYQKTRFCPRLSVSPAESQVLEVQAWKNVLDKVHHYSSCGPEASGEELPHRQNTPGGMLLSIVSPNGGTVARHCLIARSMVVGSSDSAQIRCQGSDLNPFHAYIHWIDHHLWMEPCNPTCRITVDGVRLYRDQLTPLSAGALVVLGSKTIMQVLPFG